MFVEISVKRRKSDTSLHFNHISLSVNTQHTVKTTHINHVLIGTTDIRWRVTATNNANPFSITLRQK